MAQVSKLSEFLKDSNGESLWPHPKVEAWKYFDFKRLKKFANYEQAHSGLESSQLSVSKDINSSIIIKSQGYVISQDLIDQGVTCKLQPCRKSLNQQGRLDNRFQTLNQKFQQLYLGFENLKINDNIHILHRLDNKDQDVYAPSVFLDFKNSEVSLVENIETRDLNQQSFNSVLCQCNLVGSTLRHFLVQNALRDSQALMYFSEALLDQSSNYKIFVSTLNTHFVRNQNGVHMKDKASHAEILSFVLGGQKAYAESRTEISHFDESCTSHQVFKAILSDQAKVVFNGRIYVDPKAQKTDSSQSCKGLLLSEKAQMNAKPELEIYADDVKAAHGAAIGQVSKNELFYLLSRGISPDKAYELLAQAFAGEVINEIKDKEIRQQIEKQIRTACSPIFEDLVKTYVETYKNSQETLASPKES